MAVGRFTLLVAFVIGVLFSPMKLDAQQSEKIPKVGYLSLSSSEAPGDGASAHDLLGTSLRRGGGPIVLRGELERHWAPRRGIGSDSRAFPDRGSSFARQ